MKVREFWIRLRGPTDDGEDVLMREVLPDLDKAYKECEKFLRMLSSEDYYHSLPFAKSKAGIILSYIKDARKGK